VELSRNQVGKRLGKLLAYFLTTVSTANQLDLSNNWRRALKK